MQRPAGPQPFPEFQMYAQAPTLPVQAQVLQPQISPVRISHESIMQGLIPAIRVVASTETALQPTVAVP